MEEAEANDATLPHHICCSCRGNKGGLLFIGHSVLWCASVLDYLLACCLTWLFIQCALYVTVGWLCCTHCCKFSRLSQRNLVVFWWLSALSSCICHSSTADVRFCKDFVGCFSFSSCRSVFSCRQMHLDSSSTSYFCTGHELLWCYEVKSIWCLSYRAQTSQGILKSLKLFENEYTLCSKKVMHQAHISNTVY